LHAPDAMRFILALTLLGALGGCSSSDSVAPSEATDACKGAPDLEACFTKHYLHGAEPDDGATCDTGSKNAIHAKRRLVFHTSPASGDAAAQKEGRILQRYFAPYDLQFTTNQSARFVWFEQALDGDIASIEARARAEGLDVANPSPSQKARLRALVGETITANVRSFVTSVSSPPTTDVHVVVISQIVAAALAKQMSLNGTIVGLGLSPQLLRDVQAGDSSQNLFELFGLPAEFSPVLFIGNADLVALASGNVGDVVAAHELGHSMGLQHTTDPKNLMYPNVNAQTVCLPALSDAQVAGLAGVAGKIDAQMQQTDGVTLLTKLVDSASERVARRSMNPRE
jgi:hypothetical protein